MRWFPLKQKVLYNAHTVYLQHSVYLLSIYIHTDAKASKK